MNIKIHGMLAFICAPFLYNDFFIIGQSSLTLDNGFLVVVCIATFLYSIIALKPTGKLGRTKPEPMASLLTLSAATKLRGWKQYIPVIISLCFPPGVAPSITSGINFIAGTYPNVIRKSMAREIVTHEIES